MNWNSTQQSRLSVEKDLLDSKLNGVTWLDPTVAGKTRVEWQMRTNNKQNFTLRVYLSDKFPNECPKLVVSSSPYGSPLKKIYLNVKWLFVYLLSREQIAFAS